MQPSPVIREYPDAPLPTKRTLRRRQNLAVQAVKFIGSSLNIMMMVIKGHDKP
ncbi:hypothetical protein SAMN02910418_01191 [Bowdeniella nasicola]|uniref:Transposase DDE domain-containing protein n=1 Tax=Bowdeniella nasicola TaxID=208480 RepID=A0A1H3ZLV0_9ACTO|nr:hypothetical protein [Bowdeniella nasicola]SEA24381.1 hypothetical protein SAMN02910418_01191 [Bowdeniella nasicola]